MNIERKFKTETGTTYNHVRIFNGEGVLTGTQFERVKKGGESSDLDGFAYVSLKQIPDLVDKIGQGVTGLDLIKYAENLEYK